MNNKRIPKWLDPVGVFALFLIAGFCLNAADTVMRRDADSFMQSVISWQESRRGKVSDQAAFLGVPEAELLRYNPTARHALVMRKQFSIWEQSVGKPVPKAILQAATEYENSAASGIMTFAGESLGDRVRPFAAQAIRANPELGCKGMIVANAGFAGHWSGICYDTRGPNPQDYPLGRVYIQSTLGVGFDFAESWASIRRNIPWILALFIWINWRHRWLGIAQKLGFIREEESEPEDGKTRIGRGRDT